MIGNITQPVYEEPTGSVELGGLPIRIMEINTNYLIRIMLIIEGSGTSYKISGLAGGAYILHCDKLLTDAHQQNRSEVLISTLGKPDLLITDPPAVCFPATG